VLINLRAAVTSPAWKNVNCYRAAVFTSEEQSGDCRPTSNESFQPLGRFILCVAKKNRRRFVREEERHGDKA
jgi:hypothetical protein